MSKTMKAYRGAVSALRSYIEDVDEGSRHAEPEVEERLHAAVTRAQRAVEAERTFDSYLDLPEAPEPEVKAEERAEPEAPPAKNLPLTRGTEQPGKATPNQSEQLRSLFGAQRGSAVDGYFPMSKRAISTGTTGFPEATEVADRIWQEMRQASIMLDVATVYRTAGGNPFVVPVVTTFPGTAQFGQQIAPIVAEGATISNADPTFTNRTLDAYKAAYSTYVSYEAMTDEAVSIEEMLTRVGGQTLGLTIDYYGIQGTGATSGAGQPHGIESRIVTATGGTRVTEATPSAVDADSMIALYYGVPQPYRANGIYLVSDAMERLMREAKDSDDQYLWGPSLVEGTPARFNGRPVYNTPFLDSYTGTAGNIPAYFGDPRNIAVRLVEGFRIERNDNVRFESDQSVIRVIARFDTDLLVAESFSQLFVTAASG